MAKSKSRKYRVSPKSLREQSAGRGAREPVPNAIPIADVRPPLRFFGGEGLPPWNRPEVFQGLNVLIAAFEEVAEYDPRRHHNQPPPGLWLDHRAYLADVKNLLTELRELKEVLRALADRDPSKASKAVEKKVNVAIAVLGAAGKKFVESYADLLGKGAAALTIAAIAGFLGSAGLPKELLDAIWAHFKGSK